MKPVAAQPQQTQTHLKRISVNPNKGDLNNQKQEQTTNHSS